MQDLIRTPFHADGALDREADRLGADMPMRSKDEARKRHGMTAELAANILEHLIGERLPAGAHVPAQDLADRFDVSRSPVMEALRLLTAKGVLRHERNRGFFAAEALAGADRAGLTGESIVTRAYFQIAEDRLEGLLADQV